MATDSGTVAGSGDGSTAPSENLDGRGQMEVGVAPVFGGVFGGPYGAGTPDIHRGFTAFSR